jgi:hypothetical protein
MRLMRKTAITVFACAVALGAAAPAGADIQELGVSATSPLVDASCPDPCFAIGRVTGYPVQIGALKNPMLLTGSGKIVAFSVKMSTPNADQITFFNNQFGSPPKVRLTVIKTAKTKHRARVFAQSGDYTVSTYFGSTPTFVLDKPIAVTKRMVVAITTTSWIPAFTVNQPKDVAWRFARKDCTDGTEAAALTDDKQLATFSCFSRTARPLYTVTFVPDNKVTSPDTTTNQGDNQGGGTGNTKPKTLGGGLGQQ